MGTRKKYKKKINKHRLELKTNGQRNTDPPYSFDEYEGCKDPYPLSPTFQKEKKISQISW